jgi:hypothetical protein
MYNVDMILHCDFTRQQSAVTIISECTFSLFRSEADFYLCLYVNV